MKSVILYAGLVLLTTLHIQAQSEARLYAVTFYNRQFITIDTNSGAGTLITNLPASPFDLAVNDGKLWALTGVTGVEKLLHIDSWTGAILDQKSFTSSISGGAG